MTMKAFYRIGMLAVAALAFAGCSKEVDNAAEKSTGTHTLTFTVQKDVDTRTAVVEGDGVASYVWTEGDEDYFVVFENDKKATSVVMSDLSADHKIATFKATFNDSEATDFVYTAVYGSNVSNAKNPLIPYEQSPALNSFDPAADALVSAEEIVLESGAKADENTEFKFKLNRVVSANKMTLKGLVPGEKISRVELESSDNYLTSRYRFVNKDYLNTDGSQKLVLDYSKINAVVGEDGTFPVYFTCAPVEGASFSVRVTTDSRLYTRDDFTSKLTLAVGTFRRFGINLSEYGAPIQSGTEYKLVEDDKQIVDGAEYLIVAKDKKKAAGSYNAAKYYNAVDVTVESNVISITSEAVQVFTLEAGTTDGQFNIKDADGKYLKWNSGNYVEQSATGYLWTVTKDGITSVNTTERKLQYNSSNPRFACYTSSQTAIELYVNEATLVELADPELSFAETAVNVAWEDIEEFTSPTLNNPHGLTVSYSSSNEAVATINDETGEVSFVGDGTTVITASSERTSEYKAGSAQYTLTVTGAPVSYDFTSVAELNALASSTAEYNGTLTDAVISFVPDTKNAVIKDATGSVLVFKADHGYKQGQTFSGELTVKVTLYNNASEITEINATFTGDGAVIAPETVTLADLVGNFKTWQNAYVHVEDLEVVSVSGKNINVKNGDKTYVVYSSPADATCAAGDIIAVTGTIAQYSNKDQVKAWTADDIVITQEHQKAKHTITFTQPAEGGTFTVSANGSQISSGDELDEGTVVTLEATVAEGYIFNGWTVTGATVNENSFTVGTEDVTIVANFILDQGGTDVTFAPADFSNQGTSGTGDAISSTKSGITFACDKGYGTTQIRCYSGSNISITAESGKTIIGIKFTFSSTYTGGLETTYSNLNTSSWTKTLSSQARITGIIVTYK